MTPNLIEVATTCIEHGFSVIPVRDDKKPAIREWGSYQAAPMMQADVQRHFARADRLALIGGRVSGNLECIDFDDPETYAPFLDLLTAQDPSLAKSLCKRRTPSGGYHLFYRCTEPVEGNQKLACTEKGEVRIETRAEGGYFLTAPSPGYSVLEHSLRETPPITGGQRAMLLTLARVFDQRPGKNAQHSPGSPANRDNTASPGSAFNARHEVAELLARYGWGEDRRTTAGMGWTRPGKEYGTSGVLLETGNFYCWSSNAAPLEPGRSYDAFGLYAAYEHGFDFKAAAKELASKGYGAPAPAPAPRTEPSPRPVIATGPEPLPDELLPVAAFDFALLPDSLRPWAQDICERIQCPPDFVAAGIMTGLAAVIGRKIGIRPQARTDWTVTPNTWGLVVGRPGVLKSPALEATLAPLKRLVTQANDRYAQAMTDYKMEKVITELRAGAVQKEARKRLEKDSNADISALLSGAEPAEPTLRRYIANDTSPASLGELLRQNPNGLLAYRDELVSLLKGLDREDQAEGRGFYLTAWNGDSSYTFDRILRGLNLHIDAVCLSLLGGTQPGRLAEYIRQAVKGGAADDGLIQRFGLLVWPDQGGDWKDVDRWPDSEAKNQAFKVYDRLDKLVPDEIGATQDVSHDGTPEGMPFLRFDAEALGLFLEWRTDLETRLRGGDLHPALESHFAKYRKLIPALALIIHLADGGAGPVTRTATLQALAWSEYLETHARRAYGAVSQPDVAAAKAILQRIKKGDLSTPFASWNVWRPGWAMLSDRDQVAQALRTLVDYNWLWEERQETRGRPATIYHTTGWGQS
ncbi:MAG: DUF3987 domain-containing protein [Desulfobacteraceae bacterium]|nr:DUF3987 domain-containing protein [Desulfobacteraceae bacterium]